jgi:hypothetical protein
MEKLVPLHTAGGNVHDAVAGENSLVVPQKLTHRIVI